MKCPKCGTKHKYDHSAQKCFDDVQHLKNYAVIAQSENLNEIQEEFSVMEEYYKNLPEDPEWVRSQKDYLDLCEAIMGRKLRGNKN